MPDHETRVRHRYTGEPDCFHYSPGPRQAGEAYRKIRREIEESGRGGEVAIQERPVGRWADTGEVAVIPAAGEGA